MYHNLKIVIIVINNSYFTATFTSNNSNMHLQQA